MIQALIKKQFRELFASWFVDKKTGNRRSGKGTTGMIVLFLFLILVVAVCFGAMGTLLCSSMVPQGLGWLYFAIMGLISLAMGVFGSVFNTFSSLYQAKDNDLLLSMPIPPAYLLVSRMVGVYGMSLLYTGMVYLPAAVVYWVMAKAGGPSILFSLLLWLLLSMVVLSLTCALGYVVAQVAGRLRHKGVTTVLLSLALLGVYYFCYFKLNTFLQYLSENASLVGDKLQSIWPLYVFGQAACGDGTYMLLFALMSLVLFALTLYIMARSFLRLAVANGMAERKVRKVAPHTQRKPATALLLRELKRFLGSPVYMLNGGLGVLLMPIAAVVLLWKESELNGMLAEYSLVLPELPSLLPLLGVGCVCLLTSMNLLTSCSVSLEGRQLWVLCSAPMSGKTVLSAKVHMHLLLTGIPAGLCLVCLWGVLKLPLLSLLPGGAVVFAFLYLWGVAGLLMDLHRPHLSWTSEVAAVKQSIGGLICVLGGWVSAALLIGLMYLLSGFLPAPLTLLLTAGLLAGLCLLLRHRLFTYGVKVWDSL